MDRHAVELLFEKLSEFGNRDGVAPLWTRIAGFSFFPGGAGLGEAKADEPLPRFPTGGVMILGHNLWLSLREDGDLPRTLPLAYPCDRLFS